MIIKAKKILPQSINDALNVFYKTVGDKTDWLLIGSTSLILQGADLGAELDIDILTSKEGAFLIDKLLCEYRTRMPNPNKDISEKYISYFGQYLINDVNIDVMGDFQYKKENGSWSEIINLNEYKIFQLDDMNFKILPLEVEIEEYKATKRWDKVKVIQKMILELKLP